MDSDLKKGGASGSCPLSGTKSVTPTQPALTGITDEDQVKQIAGVSKGMTKTMTDSLSIPFFAYQDDYEASNLIALRKEFKKTVPKLTVLPFFIKALSLIHI